MPAKDLYHHVVKTALEKDGWTITHDPYKFEVGEVEYRIEWSYLILIIKRFCNG